MIKASDAQIEVTGGGLIPSRPVQVSSAEALPGSGLGYPLPDRDPDLSRRQPLRILIAEDDPCVSQVLAMVLTHYGYSVQTAEDGAAALASLLDDFEGFDLLITDHQMPGLEGLGLVTRLRSLNYPGKIIVFASPPTHEAQSAYKNLHVDRLLFKPLENELLVQAIEEVRFEPKEKGHPRPKF